MATSGVKNISLDTTSLIETMYKRLGILGEGRSLSSQQFEDAKFELNLILKNWQSEDGINVWKNRTATLFLEQGIISYELGNDQANATEDFAETTISIAGNAGGFTITVDSDDDILDGDFIGIELSDGSAQWTTVNGSPVNDVVTLTDALLLDIDVDAQVIAYTDKITRPLRLSQVLYKVDGDDESETPCDEFTRDEYYSTPNKTNQGSSLQYYPNLNIDTMTIKVWSAPDATFRRYFFTYQPSFDLFVENDDEPDFIEEAYNALIYNLAVVMGINNGYNEQTSPRFKEIKNQATERYQKLASYVRQPIDMKVEVNCEGF